MSTHGDRIVRTAAIAKEYGLKEPLAREIVTEETQLALRRSKVAWLVLLGGASFAGWLLFSPGSSRDSAIWILLAVVAFWLMLGRYLAGAAIHKAAADKATRIHGLHS